MIRQKMLCAFCVVLFWCTGAFAGYIEGIDTTDVEGYGLDSAFRVTSSFYNPITGQNIVRYLCDESSTGYFNYAFNDIKMAPDSNKSVPLVRVLHCFVIKKTKDNTYSKVQILSRLTDNRYVYRYGTNTLPNDPLLENPAYDRSVRYKPNNFHNIFQYHCTSGDFCMRNTSSWDPPLPNDNRLLGYIYYRAKNGVTIDTTAPINMAQWDSVAFTASTSYVFSGQPQQYFNLVAVYAEGRSEFLLGWTRRNGIQIGVDRDSPAAKKVQNSIEIKKTGDGYYISVPQRTARPLSISIYTINGVKVANFSSIKNNKVFWKTTDRSIAEGQYIVTVELPDKSTISRTITFSRK